jgi:hypothetical protein
MPLLMGRLLASVADNLIAHVPGLVPDDEHSQREKLVYERVAARHREAAAMLFAIGDEMAACRNMPMGQHDLVALSSAPVVDALAGMVHAEGELATLLEQQLTEHRTMLRTNRSG